MTRLRRVLALFLLALLPACASTEPINGCVLTAANRREVLRASGYLDRRIPARIIGVRLGNTRTPTFGHAALIFRLDAGWFAYDEFGTRPLHLNQEGASDVLPIVAARAAFPGWYVVSAQWLDPAH